MHALACLKEQCKIDINTAAPAQLKEILQQAIATKQWMLDGIVSSREKDYTNPFRKMVYDNQAEMDNVLGSFADNSFILQEQAEMETFRKKVEGLIKKLK